MPNPNVTATGCIPVEGRPRRCMGERGVPGELAEIFDAAEAHRMGLLHQVVAEEALDSTVQRQIDLLLKAGPLASASAKTLVRETAAQYDRDALDAANAALIARLRVSPEGQEGLAAFLEKRPPAWAPKE